MEAALARLSLSLHLSKCHIHGWKSHVAVQMSLGWINLTLRQAYHLLLAVFLETGCYVHQMHRIVRRRLTSGSKVDPD